MTPNTHSVDLTTHELRLIALALETQEKILSVQSRAGRDNVAAKKLTDLKSVLRRVQEHAPKESKSGQSWTDLARTWFG